MTFINKSHVSKWLQVHSVSMFCIGYLTVMMTMIHCIDT